MKKLILILLTTLALCACSTKEQVLTFKDRPIDGHIAKFSNFLALMGHECTSSDSDISYWYRSHKGGEFEGYNVEDISVWANTSNFLVKSVDISIPVKDLNDFLKCYKHFKNIFKKKYGIKFKEEPSLINDYCVKEEFGVYYIEMEYYKDDNGKQYMYIDLGNNANK